jgi:hypothetical protein
MLAIRGLRAQASGMADKPNPRTERLRSALRENLKRRKEQAMGRAQIKPDAPADADQGRNSARIADDQERES